MAKKHQNLQEYASNLSTTKAQLYRKIMAETGCSYKTAERWCAMDYTTKNAKYLKALSTITGIKEADLFRRNA